MKIENVDGTPVGHILLRPKPKNPDVVDKYLQAANNCIDAGPNKVFNPQLVEKLFTTEIRKHDKSDCDGHLRFDTENSKQWGCVWRERLKCQNVIFVAARLKGKGFKIVCPNHEGVCTANIAEDASIGNEEHTAAGVQLSKVCCKLNQSFNVHQGELYTVKQHMPEVIKTIVMCYKGYCGSSCKVNSYVCAGLPSNHWIKNFIPNGSTCRMTCDDEVKLENCIGILLAPNSLNLVRFLTSTQKSGAFNRALSRCNPKNVSFPRNFPGRAHAAVYMINHRFANSAFLLTEQLGVKITAPKVIRKLKQRDRRQLYIYKHKRSHVEKLQRAKSRNRRYRLHALIHYSQLAFIPKALQIHTMIKIV
ncbi:unnamed protein product [Mytilus edulis]|uniref:Uncharacterized protein n=1 Tax=Mytilus edulis TaxID=6550 RepID=A0A8S3Q9M8_MYTED|nr:unnamed protein product [Mytilus edulis]